MEEFAEVFDAAFIDEGIRNIYEPTDDFAQLTEIPTTGIELRNDIEGFIGQDLLVIGSPFEKIDQLDWSQGDNSYNALGCCGLASCANLLNIADIPCDEESIVGYAIENDLCNYGDSWFDRLFGDPASDGRTDDLQIEQILEDHGLSVTAYPSHSPEGSVDGLANAVESGHGVTIGVNAGMLWDDPNCYDMGQANHQITVTGTLRNPETGELVGFCICDSGRGLESDACRSITREEMEACYGNAAYSTAIITDYPISNTLTTKGGTPA